MSRADDAIDRLKAQLSRLPGIGERTAARLVYHLLRADREVMTSLGQALLDAAHEAHECTRCFTVTARPGLCPLCADARRDARMVCVVATVQDVAAIEATGEYNGAYHVLHGTLSPLDGIGPDQLRLAGLFSRLSQDDVDEVIVATPTTVDGEATALYVVRSLAHIDVKVSRIASGVPIGGDLSYADRSSLAHSLLARRPLSSEI